MYNDELIKLNTSLMECFNHLQKLKELAVISKQYESTAKLREQELKLVQVSKDINQFLTGWPPDFRKPFGQLFYNRLFEFAEANEWRIPAGVEDNFMQRKLLLNNENVITNEQTLNLTRLNQRLAAAQFRLLDFLEYIRREVRSGDLSMSFMNGIVTLICYTKPDNAPAIIGKPRNEKPYYRQRFATTEMLNNARFFDASAEDTTDVHDPDGLTAIMNEQQPDCFVYTKLISEGLLATADLVKISAVRLSVEAKFNFEKFKMAF